MSTNGRGSILGVTTGAPRSPRLTRNELYGLVENAMIRRSNLLQTILDPTKDIDTECGYPQTISAEHYRYMYDREGIAARVVSVYPEECWAVDPNVYDVEDPEESDFKKALKEFDRKFNLWSVLQQADEVSGIGQFGVLLIGLGDGEEDLTRPVRGIDDWGKATGKSKETEVLFLRPFDETLVSIKDWEDRRDNPRYGHPTVYTITQVDMNNLGSDTHPPMEDIDVHWTRVIHIADNRKSSPVFGRPRMRPVYNRLYDLRKIVSGSGEMFWKGALPGYALEVDSEATFDPEEAREEVAKYFDSLQRYMALRGISAKSLAPQVADPSDHFEVQVTSICITIGVPKRVFMGSEQAHQASTQDTKRWNGRLARRQRRYLTPCLIRPVIDRLVAFGALPPPKDDEYQADWPDLDTPSDLDKAEVAAKRTEAFAKYTQGGVQELIPEAEYLSMIHEMTDDEVKAIEEAAVERQAELEAERQEEEMRQAEMMEQQFKAQAAAGVAPKPPIGTRQPPAGLKKPVPPQRR